ncbi:GTP-binding protein LepA [Dictyocaulus viviparus]|uniref:Translation factor GUF1 homolog, mitochondrial n=1 Tax=Dictyocaulus viviparus TaxID=29172 RepID=A0A0D8Y0T3_DICVI|nr:GTP-binding protein LepA [Dictyocaulus viviparus]
MLDVTTMLFLIRPRTAFGYPNYRCFSRWSSEVSKLIDLCKYPPEKIRNFSIVAHVDHGKSTLADRMLEFAGLVKPDERCHLILDRLPVEKERGITVKAQTAALPYKGYLLNLIDTPGHADFSAEVNRSVAVCDGILLLVAANEGVQAQTFANFWLAFEKNIQIVPVITKTDLSGANVPKVEGEMKSLFGFKPEECLKVSAKTGLNIESVFDAIVRWIPPPVAKCKAPFRAQIFDSVFDRFRGAIAIIQIKDGSISKGQKIRSYHYGKQYEVTEVGIMQPDMTPCLSLYAGQVGYVVCNMKTVKEVTVGETLFDATNVNSVEALPYFKPVNPTVYASLFPLETFQYNELKQALERLSLNDPSVVITPDSSPALGMGWKAGFHGVLHMEVFGARLAQEYGTCVIFTYPSVEYKAVVKDNETVRKKRFDGKTVVSIIDPSKFPDESDIESFLEPIIKITMVIPSKFLGNVNSLCSDCRGERGEIRSTNEDMLIITWRLPLAEVLVDFFDQLKKITSGYVTFDYEMDGYKETNLIRLTITINGREVPEFSQIVPSLMAKERAKVIVHRLKKEIPRQQFEVTIKVFQTWYSKMSRQNLLCKAAVLLECR